MVGFGFVKRFHRLERRYDRTAKDVRFVELADIRFSDPALVVVSIENGRSVLTADVVTLAVQLRWVVCHRKEYLEQLSKRQLGRVEFDRDGLGMIRLTAATDLIAHGIGRSSGVSGFHRDDAVQLAVNGFNTPKASSGKNRCLHIA